ncbi:hypothetical protein Bb109J_c1276 [Bdellovibrio bacteriovorus]|uniref:TolC family protein n=1 Tax=Bdellovibrio bacteriovorus TaxID=959 RepID=UPI00045BF473|nr:TolC family protein [Bdellovibrio bacteriovorus]AHZ86609.1 membrane protein [Bdellovibrio bacteriovorus]BEV67856.1 hypothetical protein Bb109J_c1276 [Bdellovibrio bacteriovorus]
MKVFAALLLAALVTSSAAFAAPKTTAQNNATVKINPDTLRRLFLDRNVGIAISLNNVHQAKERVNVARGNLLPSVNLGGAISSGPSFALNSVSFLLPFLMPSNWMDLKENTYLLKAQGMSHYIAQLNGYSSAYSIYMTILGDIELRGILSLQYENLKAIEEQLRLPAQLGMIREEEYLQAQAQTQMALVQLSQVDELVLQEKAATRELLGLPLTTEIVFEDAAVAVSPVENWSPQSLLTQVHEKSPESRQMAAMITSAQYNKWSKAFSFLGGHSLGASRMNGAMGSLEHSGSVNFGFAYFPNLKISNLNIEQLKLRKKELQFEQANLIEVTLGSLMEAQKQYNAAALAHANLVKVYDAEVLRYKLGMTDLLHVLEASNGLTNSVTNKIKAQTALNTLRISLHRIMISEQFAKVEDCEIERRGSGGIKGKLGRVFNPEKYQVTLDEVCGN